MQQEKPIRMRHRKDFVITNEEGNRFVTPAFIFQAYTRPECNRYQNQIRFGLTATRKIGGAVQRNRARRRLRALAMEYLMRQAQPRTDYVLIARAEVLTHPFETMVSDLMRAMKFMRMRKEEAER